MAEKPTTKLCRHCKTEIPYTAKVCPQCRKKVKGGKLKWIIIIIAVLVIVAAVSGGGKEKSSDPQKIGTVDNPPDETINTSAAGQTAGKNDTEEPQALPEENVKTVYYVGDILQDGDMKIVYMSSGEYIEANEFLQPKEGNVYIYLQFAFENTSTSSDKSISSFSFNCFADGYSADAYYGGENDLSATLSAGRSTTGYVYFEIPQNAQEVEIEYETNFFTEKKITFLYEGDKDSGYVLEANTAATEDAFSVGDIVEAKNIFISYLSLENYTSDNTFLQPQNGYHYISCEFEFENKGDTDEVISSLSFDCFADGISCSQTFIRDDDLSATLSAGRKTKGTVTFEVPDNASVIEVEYLTNYWTSNRVVFKAY